MEPLLTMIVLVAVFGKVRGNDNPMLPVYILSGRLIFSYFSNATKSSMKSIRVNSQMIKKVYVPKYIYPLASVISQYITFLISLIVLVGVVIYSKVKPTFYVVQAIVPLTILFMLVLGVGLILATMAVFFRDTEYLWGVVLMLIMYCSAIFIKPELMIDNGVGWILDFNPLYAVIFNFRNSVIYGLPLDLYYLLYSLGFSVASLIIGIWMFYKKQDQFILNI